MEVYDPKKDNWDTADTIISKKVPGKFGDSVNKFLWEGVLNKSYSNVIGDKYFGVYYKIDFDSPIIVREPDGDEWWFSSAVVWKDEEGFVKSDQDIDEEWKELAVNYEEYLELEENEEAEVDLEEWIKE